MGKRCVRCVLLLLFSTLPPRNVTPEVVSLLPEKRGVCVQPMTENGGPTFLLWVSKNRTKIDMK